MAVLTKLGKNDTISNNHVTKEGEKFFPLRIFKQCRTERTNPTGFFSEKKNLLKYSEDNCLRGGFKSKE